MRKQLGLSGLVLTLTLAALPTPAAALTCPNAAGFQRYYSVDPASACVWGDGKINNAGQDDFLDGSGITGGFNAAAILGGHSSGAAAGWAAVDYDFGSNPGAGGGSWSFSADPGFEYLVGIKDGNSPSHKPHWAVFLVSASSGFWQALDQGGGNAWSHGVLYRRGVEVSAPEPAMLVLFGAGLVFAGRRLRRIKA